VAHTYKKDVEEYIFTRPEMAKLLGISTNALRCRMRKGKCDLEYRFDGKNFLFKRPRDIKPHGPSRNTPKTTHEKSLEDYDRKVQKRLFPKRYDRGSTHREHGGKPSRKGKYSQQSFKQHNELKLLNSLQGKYQNDAQRREFEAMNEEALKEADKRAKKKADSFLNDYHGRPKYGGMIRGYSQPYYELPYELDREPPPSSSFHIGGKPYGEQEGYGNYAPSEEEKQKPIITWDEPVIKDPGADYKPGKFKHLDEAIKNSKDNKR